MGSRPASSSAALVRLNGLLPKKPLWALSGDGWADSITVWRRGVDQAPSSCGPARPTG